MRQNMVAMMSSISHTRDASRAGNRTGRGVDRPAQRMRVAVLRPRPRAGLDRDQGSANETSMHGCL